MAQGNWDGAFPCRMIKLQRVAPRGSQPTSIPSITDPGHSPPRAFFRQTMLTERLPLQAGGGGFWASPGILWMVMARMSSVILLQLLPPGCARFPREDARVAETSPRPVAATFFRWYASPFSLLSEQERDGKDSVIKTWHSKISHQLRCRPPVGASVC